MRISGSLGLQLPYPQKYCSFRFNKSWDGGTNRELSHSEFRSFYYLGHQPWLLFKDYTSLATVPVGRPVHYTPFPREAYPSNLTLITMSFRCFFYLVVICLAESGGMRIKKIAFRITALALTLYKRLSPSHAHCVVSPGGGFAYTVWYKELLASRKEWVVSFIWRIELSHLDQEQLFNSYIAQVELPSRLCRRLPHFSLSFWALFINGGKKFRARLHPAIPDGQNAEGCPAERGTWDNRSSFGVEAFGTQRFRWGSEMSRLSRSGITGGRGGGPIQEFENLGRRGLLPYK